MYICNCNPGSHTYDIMPNSRGNNQQCRSSDKQRCYKTAVVSSSINICRLKTTATPPAPAITTRSARHGIDDKDDDVEAVGFF